MMKRVVEADQAPLHKGRLPFAGPMETVLTNATLLDHIVGFQDGLPGLLCELKLLVRSHSGDPTDLASAAALQRNLRAFEMIEALRQQPRFHAIDFRLTYSSAATTACRLGDVQILRWIINCPTIEHRLDRQEMKAMWGCAVRHFKPDNFSILELLAVYFTPAQVSKLGEGTWSSLHNAQLLRWITARYTVKLSSELLSRAISDGNDEYVLYWISHRPEPLPKKMIVQALRYWYYEEETFAALFRHRVHDEDERLELITIAVEQEDLDVLKLLHEDKDKYPFEKPPVDALQLAMMRGQLELARELCSQHESLSIDEVS